MKKIVFAYIVFLLLSSEAISFIAYYIYQGKAFSYSELNNYRTSIASQTQSNFATQPELLIPIWVMFTIQTLLREWVRLE